MANDPARRDQMTKEIRSTNSEKPRSGLMKLAVRPALRDHGTGPYRNHGVAERRLIRE